MMDLIAQMERGFHFEVNNLGDAYPFDARLRKQQVAWASLRRGEPPCRKLARVELPDGWDLDGLSVLEAPIEFGLTGRRVADGKATFHSQSQKAAQLSAQPQLAVRRASRFLSDHMRAFSERATSRS